jgi:rSAM/selenodomain-associated transferase 1
MHARAVIVAAKSPVAGSVKTRLIEPGIRSADQASSLARAFLRDTISVAAAVGRADTFLYWDGDLARAPRQGGIVVRTQAGNSLGERLVHMFEQAFAAGYEQVVVIGSDSPHLPAAFLTDAFGRLAAGDEAVLGRTDDGGYCLVGLRNGGRPELFREIPWSTNGVHAATMERALAADIRVSQLPPWYDIDTPADLARLKTDLTRGVITAPHTEALLLANDNGIT